MPDPCNYSLNYELRQALGILAELGLDIASPDEARQILALKGADRVGF